MSLTLAHCPSSVRALPSVVYTLLVWEASGCCNQRRSCYSGGEYMEGAAVVCHLVWKGRIASREVYHDSFQWRETWFQPYRWHSWIFSYWQWEPKRVYWFIPQIWRIGLECKTYNKNKKSKRYFSDDPWEALRSSESLNGMGVLTMWIMVYLCVDVWFRPWAKWCGIMF